MNPTAPWHLRLIGWFAFLWMGFAAFDYTMTQLGHPAYIENFSPEQVAFFAGFPVWMDAIWAISVWVGVLGSVLLILRLSSAVAALGVAVTAQVVGAVYLFGIADPTMAEVTGQSAAIISAVITVVNLGLYFYARAMKRRGYFS